MISPRRKSSHSADPTDYTPCYAYESAGRGTRALYCEGVSLARIADEVGTPAYVYSRASIEAAYRRLDRAFGALPHTICYAMKANSNLVRAARARAAGQQLRHCFRRRARPPRPRRRSRQPHRVLRRGKNARGNSRSAPLRSEEASRQQRNFALQRGIRRGDWKFC